MLYLMLLLRVNLNKRGKNAVLISEEDWKAIEETLLEECGRTMKNN